MKVKYYAPLIIVFLVYLIFNLPLLFGLKVGGDGFLLFYPTEHELSEALKLGSLPFWTPKLQSGFPLVADGQPSSLYLLNILAFGILPTSIAHNLIILIHGMIGLFFTYKWARLLNLSAFSSAGIAFIYTVSTPLSAGNVPHLETLAWTPAIFFITESYLQRRSIKRLLVLALLVGLQWTAGFPQIAFYTLVATCIYLIIRLTTTKNSMGKRVKLFLGWGFAIILGLLLGAPQIMSTMDLASSSIRAQESQLNLTGERSLLPVALITLVQPSWKPIFSEAGLGSGPYIGIIPLIFALVGIVLGRRWYWFWPLLGLGMLTLILSWGRYSPAFPIITQVPGFSFFRVHSRFIEMTQLALLAFAAYGWDCVCQGVLQKKQDLGKPFRWVTRTIIGLSIVYLIMILIVYPLLILARDSILSFGNEYVAHNILNDPFHLQSAEYYTDKISTLYDSLLQSLNPLNLSLLIPFLILLILWLSVKFRKGTPFFQNWFYVWAALVILDLTVAYALSSSVKSPSFVQEMPKSAQLIHEDLPNRPFDLCRIYSLMGTDSINFSTDTLHLLPPNYSSLWDLDQIGLYSPLGDIDYYRAVSELSAVNLAFGVKPVDIEVFNQNRSLLNFLNVCYILSRQPLTGFEEVGRDQDVYVYYNAHAYHRFFLTKPSAISSVPDASEWTLPILHEPEVAVINYEPTKRAFEIRSDQDTVFVFTELTSKDWDVLIDGINAKDTIVDFLFWNIPVPKGTHTITMVYRPKGILTGLKITIIGIVLLIACWMIFSLSSKVQRRG